MADSVVKASFDSKGSASSKSIITPLIITDKVSDGGTNASRRFVESCLSYLFVYCMCAAIESPDPESCHPECTREYCQAHPMEICSARSVNAPLV